MVKLVKGGVEVIPHPTKIEEMLRKGYCYANETPVEPEPAEDTEEVIEDGDA